MIERIQVRAFQRHDKLRIAFDERITCITGPSDAGKSSALRAIRWLAFNRPLGDGFIRHGQDSCSVKLWVDGRKIERRKNKRENIYLIDGKQLAAVGTDVPEEVQRLLNVTTDNFQSQHEPPFWFSLTAGEVAKRLNKIVDLDVIDRSATWLTGKARKAKVELEVAERRLAEAEVERERLGFVDDLVADHKRLLKAGVRAGEITGRASRLREILVTARQTAEDGAVMHSVLGEGILAGELGRALEAKQGRLRGLRESIRLAKVSREAAGKPVPDLAELTTAYNRVEKARERRGRLSNLLRTIQLARSGADDNRIEAENAQMGLNDKIEGRCPLCGGEWK